MSVLEALKARIGEEVGVGDWMTVDQDRINLFADATDDHQWIHIDADKAAAGPFGTTIAHGFLTLSLIPEIAPKLSVDGVRMVINYGLDRVRFITPVPSGSRVRARSRLIDVSEVTGGLQIKSEVSIELDGSEKPACVAETLSRYYF
ncbi:MAG: MaoC family dehydratase [Acidimicrobiia bacterium]|nr:MaoC family dehydratase [Acidimicrobiia bacterium]